MLRTIANTLSSGSLPTRAFSRTTLSAGKPVAQITSRAYGRLCSIFYQLDKPDASPESLDYYTSQAKKAGGRILEPMCGTGRYLVPIAEEGYNITGFDASREMLQKCRKRCVETGTNPSLSVASFETFLTKHQFSLVFIPTSSFSLLTTLEKVSRSLKVIRKCLEPQGRFIFEVDTLTSRDQPEMNWRNRSVRLDNHSKINLHSASVFSPVSRIQRTFCNYKLKVNGKTIAEENEYLDVRLYQPGELLPLLTEHRFKVLNQLAPYSKEQPIAGAETLLYECQRND
ncbi:MAG: hypothetical protein S4CHLAM7_00090 [Chlamydiae bacterium]|nr:hypothetical protein [Chlamydiota bacterium]